MQGIIRWIDVQKGRALVKVKQSRYRPKGPREFQEVKVPRFHDNDTRWL
jgi:hypothetical protein